MNSSDLLVNQTLDKINEAAKNNVALTLNEIEVKAISEEFGDTVVIPVLSMEQLQEEFLKRKKK